MSRQRVVDALDESLDRIEAGATLDDALAFFPELREELEPLLTSALGVRGLPRAQASSELRGRIGAAISQLEDQRLSGAGAMPSWERIGHALAMRPASRFARGSIAALVTILLVVALLVPVRAGKSAGSLLDDVSHALRRLTLAASDGGATGLGVDAAGGPGARELAAPGRAPATPTATGRFGSGRALGPAGNTSTAVATPIRALEGGAAHAGTTLAGTATATQGSPAAELAASQSPPTVLPAAPDSPPSETEQAPTKVPTPEVAPPGPTDLPAPTATEGDRATAIPGTVEVSGTVKHDDGSPGGRSLAGAAVLLYLRGAIDCGGPEPALGAPYAQTTSAADGTFSFDVPPGEYGVAARDGPECLPQLWHLGPSDPGIADPCSAVILVLLEDGLAFQFANILYRESPGCPTAVVGSALVGQCVDSSRVIGGPWTGTLGPPRGADGTPAGRPAGPCRESP